MKTKRPKKKQNHLTFCKRCGKPKNLLKYGVCYDCVIDGRGVKLSMNHFIAKKANQKRGK